MMSQERKSTVRGHKEHPMSGWVRRLAALAGALAGAIVLVQPAWAEREEHRWHGHIERFHEHDWDVWRGGLWHHEFHDGRWGWWWVVGPTWYFYPAPVYPYPNPYEPPVAVIVPQASPKPAPPPPQPQNWYYCESARGYYPYVPTCAGGWRAVPATPGSPPATPGAMSPAPPPPSQ
jgi:hypothetical protein